MSHFANALRAALKDLAWTQTHLAEVTQLLRPQINRYIRGTSFVESSSLQRILAVLPPPHNHLVLKAYLQDSIPEQYAHLIQFESGDFKPEPAGKFPSRLNPEVKEALLTLAALSTRHIEVGDLIVNLVKTLHLRA